MAQTNGTVLPAAVPQLSHAEEQHQAAVSQARARKAKVNTSIASTDPHQHKASSQAGLTQHHVGGNNTDKSSNLVGYDPQLLQNSQDIPMEMLSKGISRTKLTNATPCIDPSASGARSASSTEAIKSSKVSPVTSVDDLKSTYFELLGILSRFRQCLDIAVALHMMCRGSPVHQSRANRTIAMMNHINLGRRPFERQLVVLNGMIEEKVGKETWSAIKGSAQCDPVFLGWLEREYEVWNWRLEQIGESATEMKINRWDLEEMFSNCLRDVSLDAVRLGLVDVQKD